MQHHQVLLTVSGRDRPGVTSALFSAFAAHDVEVVDVEQVVIRGRLVLSVLLALRGEPAPLRRAVRHAATVLGMDIDISLSDRDADIAGIGAGREDRHCVIVIGHPLRAGAVGELARRLAEQNINIDAIRRLSHRPVTTLELIVSGAGTEELRAVLARASIETGTDIAVERTGLHRRAKRLVVLDVDSTLIQGEMIDMLAVRAGCAEEVAKLTAAEAAGQVDFEAALRGRVALLAGLEATALAELSSRVRLTPGARTLIRTLKRMGYRCGVVSSGFSQVIDPLVDELGLDYATANTLEVVGGRLTGGLVGPIVDRAGKATALRDFAARADVPLSQTVAVGDGANDIDMLAAAGLGIAFNAKPALAEIVETVADTELRQPYLDAILFVLGVSRDEVEQADAEDALPV